MFDVLISELKFETKSLQLVFVRQIPSLLLSASGIKLERYLVSQLQSYCFI